jgi:hypothetical protein
VERQKEVCDKTVTISIRDIEGHKPAKPGCRAKPGETSQVHVMVTEGPWPIGLLPTGLASTASRLLRRR